MNCGSICRKVTKIRWSLSYHYNYIWLVTITKSPFSKWSPPVTETGPSHGLRGQSPLSTHCHRSQLSKQDLGEIPILDASPSCHFTISSILPSLEFNSLLETPTIVEAKGSQCTDRHKQSYRVKVIIFHAQIQRREALVLKACR